MFTPKSIDECKKTKINTLYTELQKLLISQYSYMNVK